MIIDYLLIGMRVHRRRLSIKFTQGMLAELSGLSPVYISNIENNKKPNLESVKNSKCSWYYSRWTVNWKSAISPLWLSDRYRCANVWLWQIWKMTILWVPKVHKGQHPQ